MLCDSHIHFIPKEVAKYSSFYKDIWTDKEKLYDYISTYNIERALLVFPSLEVESSDIYSLYNTQIQKLSQENKRIIPAGVIDLDKDNLSDQLKQLKDFNFKVISIFSSYKKRFLLEYIMNYFEQIEKYGFYLFVHPQINRPIGYERIVDPLLTPVLEYSFDLSMFMGLLLMEKIPLRFNIKFIFSSLGGVIPFLKERFDRVYSMLRQRDMVKDLEELPSKMFKKNIYVETSSSPTELIKLAIDTFGEDKVLFGSDYPVNYKIDSYLNSFDTLGDVLKEKIFYKNFFSLFNE